MKAPSSPAPSAQDSDLRISTGITGLDDILGGGFPGGHLYVVEGDPGTGKTTIGLQFLRAGAAAREQVLYIALSETGRELDETAASHGWSLDAVDVYELTAAIGPEPDSQYTVFHPAEVELGETLKAVFDRVDRTRARRVVIDSLSEMRLLARDSLRYRREVLRLKQYFAERRATVLLLDDGTVDTTDLQLHSLAHGVVRLEQLAPVYGAERRRLRVIKLRGSEFRGGYHDFIIRHGGLSVFPRLVAAEHERPFMAENASSGLAEADVLFGGGLLHGTVTLLMGPTGVGKSLLAAQFAVAAARRGERAAIYVFDEGLQTLQASANDIGLGLSDARNAGTLTLRQIEPAGITPGQFVHLMRAAVENDGVRVVVLDSLNGYLNAMPEEQYLSAHLHELSAYLRQSGVVTIMTMAQHGVVGLSAASSADVSYLADSIVLFRYYEFRGRVRRAISVVKKRASLHEHTIRDLVIDGTGLHVGPPLEQFEGVLSGTPVYVGPADGLERNEPTR